MEIGRNDIIYNIIILFNYYYIIINSFNLESFINYFDFNIING